MIKKRSNLSRKGFIETSAIVGGSLLLNNNVDWLLNDFPEGNNLGRIVAGVRRDRGVIDIKASPDYESTTIGNYLEDDVVVCLQEVVGSIPYRNVQRWIETSEGYVWAPNVQPVKNNPNSTLSALPDDSDGMWVEITVPWVNAEFETRVNGSTWWNLLDSKFLPPRYYYSQVLWVDKIESRNGGKNYYRINEKFGNPGDILWIPGEAARRILPEEISPINPDIEQKHIIIDVSLSRQTLSCLENGKEVYFCRISSGAAPAETPLSAYGSDGFKIYNKFNALQMSGGTNEYGWMIPGIGWATFFYSPGIAIHSTFWHNNFGEPTSHGCVNVSPDDAKWIYRWTTPSVGYNEGSKDVGGTSIGTPVKVIEY